MNNLSSYLLQITSVFSVLYTLYLIFFSKLTFHQTNRCILLLLVPISIIIPFLDNLFPALSSKMVEVPIFEDVINNPYLETTGTSLTTSSFNYSIVLITIYWFISSIYLLRIFITARKLYILKKNSIVHQNKDYQLITTNVSTIFSYFDWIFIPIHKFEQYDEQILEHEKVHIRLKHSWDVVLTEVYTAFFWFNPLIYSYRRSLKSVHEFQADQGVLQNGVKTSRYMQLLLENLEATKLNNLYNYFNQSILKKRIIMMTKSKSSRLSKLKYFLIVPVCTLLISAFTSRHIEDNEFLNVIEVSEFISSPPSLFPVQNGTKDDISSRFGVARKLINGTKKNIHTGIDIKASPGTAVLATANGVVAKAKMQGNWGNLIIITHTEGYETWYAHLKGFNVKTNQEIKKGDIIGYVGTTGLSTGPHLHYEVKKNGKHVNPLSYLE